MGGQRDSFRDKDGLPREIEWNLRAALPGHEANFSMNSSTTLKAPKNSVVNRSDLGLRSLASAIIENTAKTLKRLNKVTDLKVTYTVKTQKVGRLSYVIFLIWPSKKVLAIIKLIFILSSSRHRGRAHRVQVSRSGVRRFEPHSLLFAKFRPLCRLFYAP